MGSFSLKFAVVCATVGLFYSVLSHGHEPIGTSRPLTRSERAWLKESLDLVAAQGSENCFTNVSNFKSRSLERQTQQFIPTYVDVATKDLYAPSEMLGLISPAAEPGLLPEGTMTITGSESFTVAYPKALILTRTNSKNENLGQKKMGDAQIEHRFQFNQGMLEWVTSQANLGSKSHVRCKATGKKSVAGSVVVPTTMVKTLEYRMRPSDLTLKGPATCKEGCRQKYFRPLIKDENEGAPH